MAAPSVALRHRLARDCADCRKCSLIVRDPSLRARAFGIPYLVSEASLRFNILRHRRHYRIHADRITPAAAGSVRVCAGLTPSTSSFSLSPILISPFLRAI